MKTTIAVVQPDCAVVALALLPDATDATDATDQQTS